MLKKCSFNTKFYSTEFVGPFDVGGSCPEPSYKENNDGVDHCCCGILLNDQTEIGGNCCWNKCPDKEYDAIEEKEPGRLQKCLPPGAVWRRPRGEFYKVAINLTGDLAGNLIVEK